MNFGGIFRCSQDVAASKVPKSLKAQTRDPGPARQALNPKAVALNSVLEVLYILELP